MLILAVGRHGRFGQAIDDYMARSNKLFPLQWVNVKESRGKSAQARRQEEGARILKALPDRFLLVALDEGGEELTSGDLARALGEWVSRSAGVALAIGGPEGLDQAVLDRCHRCLSLSRMTLPHDIARLVVAEQIYRATSILGHGPYHRE